MDDNLQHARTESLRQRSPRVVLLGASNLTRAISTVIETARRVLGAGRLDVYAAIGHGRSYGQSSCVCGRTICGILQCGLWDALERSHEESPDRATYALVTDIGNDIMYGNEPPAIAAWIETCIDRLAQHGAKIIVMPPPVQSIGTITPRQYRTVRRLLFPRAELSFDEAIDRARTLHDLVSAVCERCGNCLVEADSRWYGYDPIHIRQHLWADVWREVFGMWNAAPPLSPPVGPSLRRWLILRLARPQSIELFGHPLARPQPSARLPKGTLVSFY